MRVITPSRAQPLTGAIDEPLERLGGVLVGFSEVEGDMAAQQLAVLERADPPAIECVEMLSLNTADGDVEAAEFVDWTRMKFMVITCQRRDEASQG